MNEQPPQSTHHIPQSMTLLMWRIFVILFVLDTFYAVLLAYFFYSVRSGGLPQFTIISSVTGVIVLLWLLHTIKFLVELFLIVRIALRWAGTDCYLDQEKLIVFSGIFTRTEKIYDLSSLRRVHLSQGVFGRVFRFGDIHLLFASSGFNETITIAGIRNPKTYERIFKQNIMPKA